MRALGLIVAMNDEGVIGQGAELPWHISEDLKHFRRTTMGHAILMGRATHESIGKPLAGRRNIVLSRQTGLSLEGCEVAANLDAALALCSDDPMPLIVGGAKLYADALPRVTRIYLTEVHRRAEGDVFFPAFDREGFDEVERRPAETEPDVEFVVLERRT